MEEPDSSKSDMPRRYELVDLLEPTIPLSRASFPPFSILIQLFLRSADFLCLCVQNFPEYQFPSIVGRPILRSEEQGETDIVLKDIMCGDEAAAARSMLQISYPVCDMLCDGWMKHTPIHAHTGMYTRNRY